MDCVFSVGYKTEIGPDWVRTAERVKKAISMVVSKHPEMSGLQEFTIIRKENEQSISDNLLLPPGWELNPTSEEMDVFYNQKQAERHEAWKKQCETVGGFSPQTSLEAKPPSRPTGKPRNAAEAAKHIFGSGKPGHR